MISLRQHAISIAAIFLALTVGVVLGSQTLASGLLSGLRDDKSDLQHRVDELQGTNNQLTQQLGAADGFNAVTAGRVLRDTLAQRSVVVFSTPDADVGDVDGVSQAIGSAGGTVTARIGLTPAFVDPADGDRLRTAVTNVVPAGIQLRTGAVDQGSLAGDLLGAVLLTGKGASAATGQAPDDAKPAVSDDERTLAIGTLRSGGFLAAPDGAPEPAQLAVVVTGAGADPPGPGGADPGNTGSIIARFAAALDARGAGSVLAGRPGAALGHGPIAVLRADSALASATSTVDDIDRVAGRITAAIALQEQAAGRSGQYGTGPKATSVTVGETPA